MTTRGDETRAHLLDTAEQLYGERGIGAVSLREIRLASGAKNSAAVQFHFEDRNGLLEALIARHMPKIAEIQLGLYDEMVAEGRAHDRRSLVEVLVRPVAEYLTRGPSERAWTKIMDDLGAEPGLEIVDMIPVAPRAAKTVTRALLDDLCTWMPRILAKERLNVLARATVQNCADRARVQDDRTASKSAIPVEMFIENLVDMRCGSLFAPVSKKIAEKLALRT